MARSIASAGKKLLSKILWLSNAPNAGRLMISNSIGIISGIKNKIGETMFNGKKSYKQKTRIVKLSDLLPYVKNAKKHPPEQIEALKKSFQKYGYLQPIGADENGIIIFGHGRFYAMQDDPPDTEVEITDLSHLSEDQKKKLRLLDNKIVSTSYDKKTLDAEIDEIFGGKKKMDKIFDDIFFTEKDIFDLSPVKNTEAGKLREHKPIMVECPECGHVHDARETQMREAQS